MTHNLHQGLKKKPCLAYSLQIAGRRDWFLTLPKSISVNWNANRIFTRIPDFISNDDINNSFGGTYTKIGTIQRRLAWPLRKDDTQIREAFHIF